MKSITVAELIDKKREELSLSVIAGRSGLSRKITVSDLNRPGLLLAGFRGYFPAERVQVLGMTEISYLESLSSKKRRESLDLLTSYPEMPCIIIARRLKPPRRLVRFVNERGVPLIASGLFTNLLIHKLSIYLSATLAPEMTIHGTLVDVYGVGLLITGKSGIGKSECALDLVERGHRLVADDAVRVIRRGDILMGEPLARDELLRHHMEIRGIGVIDIPMLFGIRGIRLHKRIEVQVDLVHWDEKRMISQDRFGLETKVVDILGVEIPYVEVPLVPGKNVSVIAEVVAMNHLLKVMGYDTARVFDARLKEIMQKEAQKYAKFEEDTE